MSKRSPFRLALLPVAAVAMALAVTHGMCAETGSEAARLDSFTHADGANYFALTLAPGQGTPAAGGHDVVVLVDTSASQAGDYRTQGVAALKSLLAKLPPEARVQLVAVACNNQVIFRVDLPGKNYQAHRYRRSQRSSSQ